MPAGKFPIPAQPSTCQGGGGGSAPAQKHQGNISIPSLFSKASPTFIYGSFRLVCHKNELFRVENAGV